MRIKQIKVYPFDELSDEGKEQAVNKLQDINVFDEWCGCVYDDAERVGLKLTEFDIDRGNYCRGDFIETATDTARKIIEDHGPDCETYKTAMEFNKESAELYMKYPVVLDDNGDDDNEIDRDREQDELDYEFLLSILEDYRIMLQNEYEYLTSEEMIIETIRANEYEFTADGNLA
uniref:Uncharacterized protein n=1 Tax=viral metagenome TaxID=1070528 RepID=A0A6M3KD77_9ZZZZ